MKKRYLSALLALLMLCSVLLPHTAFAQSETELPYVQNPFYAHREIADGALQAITQESRSQKYNGKTYYTRGKQLYAVITKGMEARESGIQVYYLSNAYHLNVNRLVEELFAEATEDVYSVSGTDGDYLRWSVAGWETTYTFSRENGYYYYKLTLDFTYLDTAAQEKQVDAAVNRYVTALDVSDKSDVAILKTVHDDICAGTTYNYDAVDDPYAHFDAYTAYGALVTGSCVCQGYSLAFYRICKELGYSARIITSDSHAWNLVGLDGKYYYVDATWDDGYYDKGQPERGYTYFLVSENTLRSGDNLFEHVPETKFYDNEDYQNDFGSKIDENDYDFLNTNRLSNCTVTLSSTQFSYNAAAQTPDVSVTDRLGNPVPADDYTLSYTANTDTGAAVAALSGKNGYDGSCTHRLFYISPAPMGKLSLAGGGRATTALTLQWNKAGGNVSGYVLERYQNGKWSTVKTLGASATSYKVTSLSPAATHKFRIRAYKTLFQRRLYGAYSATYTGVTKPKAPAPTLKTAKKTITVSWKTVSASGYEIQRSTAKSFGKSAKTYIVGSNKRNSKKFTKLKKGKTYYVRMRAYYTYNGKRYYSAWSKTKSVKCK